MLRGNKCFQQELVALLASKAMHRSTRFARKRSSYNVRQFHFSISLANPKTNNNDDASAAHTTNVRMYDSLTERIQPLPTVQGKGLAWYTCGPTTYAPAHLGHARTYVWADIGRRIIEASMSTGTSIPPLFVMNVTDVDDKILNAATEKGIPPIELARTYEKEFWQDLQSLHCLLPHVVTRVTENVESAIVPYIQRLVDQNMAYETTDGVYFHVRAYNERMGHVTRYGKFAPPAAATSLDLSNRNIFSDNQEYSTTTTTNNVSKQDPRDFVLWKKKKPNEELSWPSPWGDGRPGWHIECSAMIEAVQSKFIQTHQFLVHAGGIDLKFPHHTNEIAQAEAYHQNGQWIPHWIHTGHLHIDGLKMSKSLKNFVTIRDFFESYGDLPQKSWMESPSDDFRLWCLGLAGSYRGPATYSKERIDEARYVRQKILRFLMDGEKWVQHRVESSVERCWNEEDYALFTSCHEIKCECLGALNNDMDGTKFLQKVMSLVDLGNAYMSERKEHGPPEPLRTAVSTLRELLSLVGFTDRTTKAGIAAEFLATGETPGQIGGVPRDAMDALVKFRSDIRHAALADAKNKVATDNMHQILQLCDELRDATLPRIGIQLLDGKAQDENDSWRECLPQAEQSEVKQGSTMPTKVTAKNSIQLGTVPLEDYFRVGTYEGQFSAYTPEGIPTHNADGSEVSKRLLKKLTKKWQAHKERLDGES